MNDVLSQIKRAAFNDEIQKIAAGKSKDPK